MNTPDDKSESTWESEMGDEFERRVRNLHEAPLDLTSVKGKAMNIRNKRRAAVAGGLVAAAALIVPVAVIVTNASSDRADGIDPSVPSETVTDTNLPTPSQSPTAVDSQNPTTPSTPAPPVTDGSALGFDYLEVGTGNAVLHQADGSTVELPRPDYSDAATLGSTIAAYRNAEGGGVVDLLEDGAITTSYDIRPPMATAPDGRTVAFITTDDELVFVNGEAGEQSFDPRQIPKGVTLSAIVGTGDCVFEAGCHPFLEYQNFEKGDAYEINYEGDDTAPAPGALRVNDAGDDFLVSVITEVRDFESCGGLYDREGGGSWVFETCDYTVSTISPGGDRVIGLPSYFDGLGPLNFSILDDQGSELAAKQTDGVIGDIAWADDSHAVASVYEDGAWKIISLSDTGDEEVLVEGASGDELAFPYRITGQS